MRKEVGGCLIVFVLLMSSFVFGASSSEINITLFVSDGSDSEPVARNSVSNNFWGIYGIYVVVVLIVFVILALWVRSVRSRTSRGDRKQITGSRLRRKSTKRKGVIKKK